MTSAVFGSPAGFWRRPLSFGMAVRHTSIHPLHRLPRAFSSRVAVHRSRGCPGAGTSNAPLQRVRLVGDTLPSGDGLHQGQGVATQGSSHGAQQGNPPAAGRAAESRRRALARHTACALHQHPVGTAGATRGTDGRRALGEACAPPVPCSTMRARGGGTPRALMSTSGGSSGRRDVGGCRCGPSLDRGLLPRAARGGLARRARARVMPRRAAAASRRAGVGRRPSRHGRRTGGRGPTRSPRCRGAPTACRPQSATESSRR